MRTRKLLLFTISLMLSMSLVNANEVEPRGIDLGEYAFGIPAKQLYFSNDYSFTLSFWVYVKMFNHDIDGTQFVNIRDVEEGFPLSEWGWMWINIVSPETLFCVVRNTTSTPDVAQLEDNTFSFSPKQWRYFTFVFERVWNNEVKLTLYADGRPVYKLNGTSTTFWNSERIIMIGGSCIGTEPLNAYIDKVQLYNKALTQSEVQTSMYEPLLNDESLLGYWDFENGCNVDTEGFMSADKGSTKATMYKILRAESDNYYDCQTIGTEIQSFTFGEGVNPEGILLGVEKNIAEENNTKAYVSAGVLYIENIEGIKSVTVYDAMGRTLLAPNLSSVERGEIAIPLDFKVKGLLLVKVNNEVVKVICN